MRNDSPLPHWKQIAVAASLVLIAWPGRADLLELSPGDRVVLVGGSYAEQMYRYGWLELALNAQYPAHRLVMRNLGWSGDTPTLQPRELGFGSALEHLATLKTSVVIACWGMTSSFDGAAGLEQFEAGLRSWRNELASQRFDDASPPRIVLVSPIAHEDLGPPLPSGEQHNAQLAAYVDAMRRVARENGDVFVDLFGPSLAYYASREQRPLTRNGIHPSDYGYWWLARETARQLEWLDESREDAPATTDSAKAILQLRSAIWDKNWHFFQRWRPVNMEYIRGSRREPFGVENFPREFDQLDRLIARRDEHIWSLPAPSVSQVFSTPPPDGRQPELWESLPEVDGGDDR